jgi:acyl transferase domain-containing protein
MNMQSPASGNRVAIVGLGGRFPGAATLERFWDNLVGGVASIARFSPEELIGAGVAAEQVSRTDYVAAKAVVDGADRFDPAPFGLSQRDAAVMDPQFRLFLEVVWEALESAGYGEEDGRRTGVFAGANANSYHEQFRLRPQLIARTGTVQATLLNQGDFLAAWASYALNLTGPSLTVQSGCSTSLAAVHLACQSLIGGECDLAVAGGVSLSFPQRIGYAYVEGGLMSPDGQCRAFDAAAQGFVPGEGVGVVVLKRLEDALAEHDTIRAVILASAINNDGGRKIGFTAPGQSGMAEAIAESLASAAVPAETIRMIEAHGAATVLGDPVEVAALTQVFRAQTTKRQFCALGSVKSNIGHAGAAAGIASLLKAVLAIEHGVVPPHRHCDNPNPVIRFPDTPFYLPLRAEAWGGDGVPRRAGVNAFGVGGTNVHVTLEEAPPAAPTCATTGGQLLVLSAKTAPALEALTDRLAVHIAAHPDVPLANVAFTLSGRRRLEHRRALVCQDVAQAVQAFQGRDPIRTWTAWENGDARTVSFLFPDSRVASLSAVAELYRSEPRFKDAFDHACGLLGGRDLRAAPRALAEGGGLALDDPVLARTFTVAVQHALGATLIAFGVQPQGFVAHGVGEIAAAWLAGVLSPAAVPVAAAGAPARARAEHAAPPARGASSVPFWPASHRAWIKAGSCPDATFTPGAPAPAAGFADTIATLLRRPDQALLDLSCGDALALIDGGPEAHAEQVLVAVLPERTGFGTGASRLLDAVGRLWIRNTPIDWRRFYGGTNPRRVALPTYPFERVRCWIGESTDGDASSPADARSAHKPPAAQREPENDLQAVIASVWAFHLGVERVCIDDSFIDLGGTSALATKIVTTLRETLQIELPLRGLLENPTVASLADAVERLAREWDMDVHLIARAVRQVQQTTPAAPLDPGREAGMVAQPQADR